MTEKARSRRALLIWSLGVAALAIIGVFAWRLATQKGVVAQLVEILSTNDAPDGAWAFEELKQLRNGDLPDLAEHVDDSRPTQLTNIYLRMAKTGEARWSFESFTVGAACRFLLEVRMEGAIKLISETGSPIHGAGETRALVLRWLRSHLDPTPPGGATENRPGPGLVSRAVRPPSRDPDLRRMLERSDVGGMLEVLTSQDSSMAHWAYEGIKQLSDVDLDRVIPRLRDGVATRILWLPGDRAVAKPPEDPAGIRLTALLCAVLAERMDNADLQKRLDADLLHPSQETIDAVESAWKAYRAVAR